MTPDLQIRCDLGAEHGLGHAVRCTALAKAFQARGRTVEFTTTTPSLADVVAPFPCCCNTVRHGVPLVIDTKAHDWANDPVFLTELRSQYKAPVVRIDHPHAHVDTCDLVIGPCAHWRPATLARLRHDFGERFLYGWDYVMLDEEVTSQPPLPYAEREDGPIVFCAGGSDPSGALQRMAEWCGGLAKTTDWFFLMPQHPATPHIMPRWATCVPFARHYLREAAMVVGLFGTTAYESLFWHTPMLMLSHTPENAEGASLLSRATLSHLNPWRGCETGGTLADYQQTMFISNITKLSQMPRVRRDMSQACHNLIDGRGVSRVADAILSLLERSLP